MKAYTWVFHTEEMHTLSREGWIVHTVVQISPHRQKYFMERDSPYLPPGSIIEIDKEGNRVRTSAKK